MREETMAQTGIAVAIIHHHPDHNYKLIESTNDQDLNQLEDQCIQKLNEITFNHRDDSFDEKDDQPDDFGLITVCEVGREGKSSDNDDLSSSVDEIEEDCSSLTSCRESLSSGESSDARGPSPLHLSPTHQRRRSTSFAETSGLKKSVKYDRSFIPWGRSPKTVSMSYNTNLKKPPENWLRMRSSSQSSGHGLWSRHGVPYWSYPYSKTYSWSMFAFKYTGRGKRSFHKGLANNLVCLCCGCCNCSRVNQTCCCCCYHCVHRISSCRRPDLMTKYKTMVPRKSGSMQAPIGEDEQEHDGEPESGLESGLESGTESTSGKASDLAHKSRSTTNGSGKSSTTLPTPSNETMPKQHKLSTLF